MNDKLDTKSAADTKWSVRRAYFDEMGRPVAGEAPVFQQNKLYYVLLEGNAASEATDDAPKDAGDVVISDYLPAGFEVAAKSILPGSSGVNPVKAALGESVGRVRHAETLDDRFVAIVTPGKEEASRGRFRLIYAIRPTLIGELTLPVTTVEVLRQPEVQHTTAVGGSITVQSAP